MAGKPNKQKSLKPISKLSGTKTANEGVSSGDADGPPDKIQEFSFSFGSGPFECGPSGSKLPDPPDKNSTGVVKDRQRLQMGLQM